MAEVSPTAASAARRIVVATGETIYTLDPASGHLAEASGLDGARPACLAGDRSAPGRVWCGTIGPGVARSDDRGRSWRFTGLDGEEVSALAVDPGGRVWAGTAPSALWRSDDGGESWRSSPELVRLPSSSEWSFPPQPDTHHVRWIACHPDDPERLWVAIEAGALVRTADGGASWADRVPGGPYDTHELAVHPARPEKLHVAAGDGYFESADGGDTWSSEERGLEVSYLRSVAIDPGDADVVLVSGAPGPYSAYVAGRSRGHVYRREGAGLWVRVTEGFPRPAASIAPLLLAGVEPGELWAADERGVHRTADGGRTWRQAAAFPETPRNLRGLARA